MAGNFVPFFPGANGAAMAGGGTSFSPVAVAGSSASPGTSPTAFTKAAAAAPVQAHQQVNIEIKRDGERISQIRIQCRCGEVIEVDCEY